MRAEEEHVEGCYDPRLGALNLLWDIRVGLAARLAPVFETHGIAEHDFDVVLQLVRAPEGALRMSDLAQRTGSSTSGMTRVVDRLEREGLVRREAHPTDRRASVVRLTSEGVARVRALLRRAEGRRAQGMMRVGELTIDPATRAVRLAGRRASGRSLDVGPPIERRRRR
jgi:DNA-binding MarR family transcriptional regulator